MYSKEERYMMWNRAELKMRGNMAFKKNYVSAVVVALLMGIFGTVSGESTDCPCGKSICR